MKEKIRILFLILSLAFFYECTAQPGGLKFNLVEGPAGKSLGGVRNMSQDPYGYMWFAAAGAKCIYRYDGSRYMVFRHDDANPNSLGGVNIYFVFADNKGLIWIGMTEGLDQYNPATGIFKHYRHNPRDSNSLGGSPGIAPVLKDRQGRIWIGTDHDGLDRLDEKSGKFTHFRNGPGNPKSLSSNAVWKIYEDRQGTIWIATGFPWFNQDPQDGGLNRLNADGTFTQYKHDSTNPHSLINNKIGAIFEDSRGNFWVGTGGDGLHIMDRKTGRFERLGYDPKKPDQLSRPPLTPGVGNDKIDFIIEDTMGAIWIGTQYSGLTRYDTGTKKITRYENSNGYPDSTSWNAFTSRDGELWITTERDNLFRVDPFHKTIDSISTVNDAWNFLEDKQRNLWVGTQGGGLIKFDQQLHLVKQFKHDPADSTSLPSNHVGALFQNHENMIWVETEKGIRVLDEITEKFSHFKADENLGTFNDTGATGILRDKEGIIWLGRWGQGLVRYNPKDHSITHFYSSERDSSSISSNHVGQILEDNSGIIWTGSDNGLNRLDKNSGKFVRYLAGTGTFSVNLFQDSEGNLWAPNSNGLYLYNKKEDRFNRFLDPKSEINSIGMGGMTEDDTKNLWFFSESGIIRLNLLSKQTFFYGSNYGIVPHSFATWKHAYKNHEGRIFIPKDNGFYTFYPKKLTVKTDFKIIITELSINSTLVLPGKESPIQIPVEEITDLDLKYNQNNISLNFSAIDYRDPATTRYFYILEGYDKEWQEVKDKKDKSSYYFNLPQGKYIYRVKAFNSDGTKAERSVNIRINPPWWQTWWAYTSYALLLILSVWAYIRWRTKSLQAEKIILEGKVTNRTRELKEEKEIVERTLSELKITQAQLIQSEKMASMGELTAGIAHEIQNPLNFVNNFSEINTELLAELKSELETGNTKEAISIADNIVDNEQKIVFHGKRADSIVKAMLLHSRSSTGQKELIDINKLADEYLRLAYHGLRAKDKSFNTAMKTDFDPQLGKIKIIPQEIGRVLLNLYNNAFYAVAERDKNQEVNYEPTVEVSTKKIGNKIVIRVKDNGNGIPQKVLNKIFQPFFTTKPTGEGTGLGLSLSFDIITKGHGGELKVETEEGKYSVFTICLPPD
jgi:signal transduction histidine kinase/ligand-binding sensor domain-containing protein